MRTFNSRFFLYALIVGASAFVDWSLFYILAILQDIHYLLSGTISFLFAVIFNYYVGIKFLFDSTARFSKQTEIFLVFLVSMVGLGINLFFLFLFSTWLAISLMLSKIMASFFTLGWNFSMRNYYVFKNPNL